MALTVKKQLPVLIMLALLSISTVACGGAGDRHGRMEWRLGVISIGELPDSPKSFVASDCDFKERDFSDCTAVDSEGLRYVFFDGALSKVSADRKEVDATFALPADLRFGEDIVEASRKTAAALGLELDRGTSSEGRVVYSSDFKVVSSSGVSFSVELVSDSDGRLHEIVERVDF